MIKKTKFYVNYEKHFRSILKSLTLTLAKF